MAELKKRSIVATDQLICVIVGFLHELFTDVPGWIPPFSGLNVRVRPYSPDKNAGTLAQVRPVGWPNDSYIACRFFVWTDLRRGNWSAEIILCCRFLQTPFLAEQLHIQSLPRLTVTKWEATTNETAEILQRVLRDKRYACHSWLLSAPAVRS